MLEILVVLAAVLFLGFVFFSRESKPAFAPVPVQSGPQVGDIIRYADKRTGNYRGVARIERFRRDGLVTLRHGPCARQFSVHPMRILSS